MNIDVIVQQVMTLAFSIGSIVLWAWTIGMLIASALLIFRSRGSERLFGLFLVVVTLLALPMLIEEYPSTLAEASNASWDKTAPQLASLASKVMNTIEGALHGQGTVDAGPAPAPTAVPLSPTMTPVYESLPPRPPGPDGSTGGDENVGGGVFVPPPASATPTATAAPTLIVTPTFTSTPSGLGDAATPTLAPTSDPSWPPTPIIMTPAASAGSPSTSSGSGGSQ